MESIVSYEHKIVSYSMINSPQMPNYSQLKIDKFGTLCSVHKTLCITASELFSIEELCVFYSTVDLTFSYILKRPPFILDNFMIQSTLIAS